MGKEVRTKESLWRNNGFQTIIASLLCIILGLLVGYVVLLIINPGGAGKAIIAILKNFLYYPSGNEIFRNNVSKGVRAFNVFFVRIICIQSGII